MDRFLAKLLKTQWQDTFVIVPIDTGLSIGGGPIIGGGPVDPGYFPPGVGPGLPGGPVDPGYFPPGIGPGLPGGPVDPGYFPPGIGPGLPGGPRPPSGGGFQNATVIPVPPQTPPTPPPAGMPPDSVQVLILFGDPRTTKPAVAWVQPYVSAAPPTPAA